jgi:hypothetical protein
VVYHLALGYLMVVENLMVVVIPAVVLVMVVDFDHLVRDYHYPVA